MLEHIIRTAWLWITLAVSWLCAPLKRYLVAPVLSVLRAIRRRNTRGGPTQDTPKSRDVEAQWDETPRHENDIKINRAKEVEETGGPALLDETEVTDEKGDRKSPEETKIEKQALEEEQRRGLLANDAIIQGLTRDLRAAKDANSEQLRQIQGLEAKLKDREKAHADLQSLYRQKTSDLRAAEQFLTKADPYSGSEITRLIKDLNTLIYQVAATIEDTFNSEFGQPREGGDGLRAAEESLSTILGVNMVGGLKSLRDDPVLVQPAIQGVLTWEASGAINAWFPNYTMERWEVNRVLSDLYESLRRDEPQPVAGRWRSLTHRHARSIAESSDAEETFVLNILHRIADVVVLAGGGHSQTQIKDRIEEEVRGDLSRIAQSVVQIHLVIKQETTSSDMELVSETPGSTFVSARMDDMEADPNQSDEGAKVETPILCTTRLGLRRIQRSVGGVEDETRLLLKPEVALESLMGIV
ncbi:hypothetical protein JAAARDRAFT_210568 [Jaapia argillacea MUCL 33604]|uniref:Uncharacterized protein n=1 Tax=Jaapia argillacea MUCL 33604 TaxID=933084 RepID=A0A067PC69_9AGAM|nr:hypothetical protein JAAARDRAFT_210568 [Jaapia argillacea MUCL 33604]